ncbi:hypothetical protein MTO96_031606 [Rhipicephalus appendiculatus]
MRRSATSVLLFAALAAEVVRSDLPPTIIDDAARHKSPFYMFSKPEESRPSCVFGSNHSASPLRVNTTGRLAQLRHLLSKENFQGYIVPSEDAHKSEFVPPHYKRREYLTWLLWGKRTFPVIEEWLKSNLRGSSRVGVDSRIVPFQEYRKMEENLHPFGIELVGEPRHLVDEIWTPMEGRPYESNSSIVVHSVEFAGESWQDKVRKVREFLKKSGIDAILITDLGEIAWLYNMRGNDVPYTPVFEAFVFLSQDEQRLYVSARKLTSEVRNYLIMEDCNNWACVQWRDYKLVYNEMNINGNAVNRLLVSPFCSYAICGHIDIDKLVVSEAPIKMMMTVKNNIELRGLRNAHLKDSIVFVTMLAHMERDYLTKKPWTEARVIYELERLRSTTGARASAASRQWVPTPQFRITTIATAQARTSATPAWCSSTPARSTSMVPRILQGQYTLGTPSDFEKEVYTRVLIGMIDLFLTIFPEGTKDGALDVVARRSLWSVGLNFLHGVSHGLGSYMLAHEHPPLISPFSKGYPLLAGMVLSNEPGYYEEERLGVRLETTMQITPFNTTYRFMSQKFCKFEPITFVPFQAGLIKWELLNKAQLDWLNDYNARILDVVGSELKRMKKHEVLSWLQARTFRVEMKNGSMPVLRVAGHHGLLSHEVPSGHHPAGHPGGQRPVNALCVADKH